MTEPHIFFKIGDGDEFDPADQISGLRYLGTDETATSPQFTNNYQDASGIDGSWFISQTLAKRTFTERFWLHFSTYYDLQLAKHDIYQIFASRQIIRVRSDHSPGKVYYGYPTPFEIAPLEGGSNDAVFSIVFDVPSGYKQSLYRSDKMAGTQYGMNIPVGQYPSYHYTTGNFVVKNLGDLKIDPYYQSHDLKIICKYSGSSITITNQTTGESWSYNRSNDGSHTITLDGVNTYYDGTNDTVNSDGGTISLVTGDNHISVSGANVDVTFSFPFLYLL